MTGRSSTLTDLGRTAATHAGSGVREARVAIVVVDLRFSSCGLRPV